ncbi:hypothetical protein NBRC116598_37750 [Pseudophaeobacter arcticus]|uniref:Uncharacterized protein n=1 Tax=Pseudophaeobacter arcticus TaxID=385492 RepID=A0ABQ0AR22_9RHOB
MSQADRKVEAFFDEINRSIPHIDLKLNSGVRGCVGIGKRPKIAQSECGGTGDAYWSLS